ncbi:DUF2752 domain-containing protein [Streptomyces sp. WMMC500]|uniref:DUF2752 domain-containing protein n=1 Tax=Streptomyces sp. WMMC500 TaxID=3015154 RepID=UPI00248C7ACC|nr:DUF2752 domain-containing protein [Streptomyces sp. WMMC500]WBB58281.1 DUF2752 domain-containing protein [Streptomyces sp. WMMC500]
MRRAGLSATEDGPTARRTAEGPAGSRRWARRRLGRAHPAALPLSLTVAGAAGAAYLYGTNPHEPGHWLPRCPFNWVTGLDCPACGATRMAYDILHGDLGSAFHSNALLLLLGLPLATVLYGRWLYEGLRGRRWQPSFGRLGTAAVLGVALVWAVVRNVA